MSNNISWSPLFSKIVDSSIWCEPDHVVKIFLTMLAKKASDHVVYGNAFNISKWSQKSEAEVLEALKILSSPDTKRLEPQLYEGRRIEKVEGGWMILNGQAYEDEMRQISRRAYKARKEREYRDKKKAMAMKGEAAFTRAVENGDEVGANAIVDEANGFLRGSPAEDKFQRAKRELRESEFKAAKERRDQE